MVIERLNTIENPINSTELTKILCVDERSLRRIIERERKAGEPIGSILNGERTGFFKGESLEEMSDTFDRLTRTANTIMQEVEAMRKRFISA